MLYLYWKFHRFPKCEVSQLKWIHAVRRKGWHPSASSVICSEHFERHCYQRPPGLRMKPLLYPDAVPTIFPSYPSHLQPVSSLN